VGPWSRDEGHHRRNSLVTAAIWGVTGLYLRTPVVNSLCSPWQGRQHPAIGIGAGLSVASF
jgi:hypothetical protein